MIRSILDVASVGKVVRVAPQVVDNRTLLVAELCASIAVVPAHTVRENALLLARIVV